MTQTPERKTSTFGESSSLLFGVTYLSADEVVAAKPVEWVSVQLIDATEPKKQRSLTSLHLEPSVASSQGQVLELTSAMWQGGSSPAPAVEQSSAEQQPRSGSVNSNSGRGSEGQATPQKQNKGGSGATTGGSSPSSAVKKVAIKEPTRPVELLSIQIYKEATLLGREDIKMTEILQIQDSPGNYSGSQCMGAGTIFFERCFSVSGTAGVQVVGVYIPTQQGAEGHHHSLIANHSRLTNQALSFALPLALKLVQDELELALEDAVLAEAKLEELSLEKTKEVDTLKRQLWKAQQKLENDGRSPRPTVAEEEKVEQKDSEEKSQQQVEHEDDEVESPLELIPDPKLSHSKIEEKEEKLQQAHDRVTELEKRIERQERKRIVMATGHDRANSSVGPDSTDADGPHQVSGLDAYVRRQQLARHRAHVKTQQPWQLEDETFIRQHREQQQRHNFDRNTVRVYTTPKKRDHSAGGRVASPQKTQTSSGHNTSASSPYKRVNTPGRKANVDEAVEKETKHSPKHRDPEQARVKTHTSTSAVVPYLTMPSTASTVGSGRGGAPVSPAPSSTYRRQKTGGSTASGLGGGGVAASVTSSNMSQSQAELRRLESIKRMEETIDRLNKVKEGRQDIPTMKLKNPTPRGGTLSARSGSNPRQPQPAPVAGAGGGGAIPPLRRLSPLHVGGTPTSSSPGTARNTHSARGVSNGGGGGRIPPQGQPASGNNTNRSYNSSYENQTSTLSDMSRGSSNHRIRSTSPLQSPLRTHKIGAVPAPKRKAFT